MAKIDIEKIKESYSRLKNVWKVGEELGLSGQSVHSRLKKAGCINSMNYFTDAENKILLLNYKKFKDLNQLDDLAKYLKRTKQFICRKAKELGLTDRNDKPVSYHHRNVQSAIMKERIKNEGHPRYMLGKKHSEESKEKMSESQKEVWADPFYTLNMGEARQANSDRMTKWQASREDKSNNYSRTKKGWWPNDQDRKHYMRSAWEFNYAYYLEYMKARGDILSWDYEAETFWFDKIKRGVRSYTPDFKIVTKNNVTVFHEVKGWMDDKSKTKIKRMKKYHPTVRLIVVDQKAYNAIKKFKKIIPGWK